MDRAELERELERLHAACWGWALACCARDRDTAEDTLQSAYLKILSGQAKFDGRSQFRTWTFGVVRRTALEERRRRATRQTREQFADAAIAAQPDSTDTADVTLEQSDDRRALLAAIATLPPRQQEVLHLVFYQDMTIEQAAAVMDISLGSARTHYDRGKKALARAL